MQQCNIKVFGTGRNRLVPVSRSVMTHVVICDSRKMRMKTRMAGTQQANMSHTGKALCSPKGLMSQPRWAGLDTVSPLGTTSFCQHKPVFTSTHSCH